jgi:Protein of unknown function (DUF2809)
VAGTAGTGPRRRRVAAAVILGAAILLGLIVHTGLPDTAATDIAGDALYPIAMYAGIVLIAPRSRPIVVGLLALAWCIGIEFFQLTGIPSAAGAVFPPAMLVLGTVFDARDLWVYALTIVVVWAIDGMLDRGRSAGTTEG